MNPWVGIPIAIAVSGLSVWLLENRSRRAVERLFRGRDPRTSQEFGDEYFDSNGESEVASRVRSLLGRYHPVDLSRLHPDDHIVRDLRIEELDSLAISEFLVAVETEFHITIPDEVAYEMRNVRDVVEYVSRTRSP